MEKNYIQNNGKAKGKIYIGLDHGYGNIKTAHRVFTTGVEAYDEEPIVSTNFVKYRDKYYVIGESHLVYQGNKTDSDDFYILTLAGLAEELKFRGLHEAEVVLAAGLPLAWVKSQAADWRAYLMQEKELDFMFQQYELLGTANGATVAHKATVPLYYENRGEKILDLDNPDITDEILDAIEAADLDPDQTEKLEHEFKKEIHIMTAPQRLQSVAKDFVSHYSDLWTSGKAMFVCLNKVTCVRMYNLVQDYWKEEIKRLEGIKSKVSQQEAQELERKIKWMKETEMAVVISQEQNEIQTFKKWNLDIKPHREKMEKRELDKEFKDKDNPLRVVFVCAICRTWKNIGYNKGKEKYYVK